MYQMMMPLMEFAMAPAMIGMAQSFVQAFQPNQQTQQAQPTQQAPTVQLVFTTAEAAKAYAETMKGANNA